MGKLIRADQVFRQGGYTYMVLLMVTAITLISASVVGRVSFQLHQRAMEKELLFRGEQYRQAIRSFYETGTPNRYPSSIDDLLQDPRFVSIHHLRRPWSDPMMGADSSWQLILNASGNIVGVASKSDRQPIKTSGFEEELLFFSEADSYQDWMFVYDPQNLIHQDESIFD